MSALAGISLLAPHIGLAPIWALKRRQYEQMLTLGPVVGWGFLLLSITFAVTSLGCFSRRHWGWILAVALIALNGAGDAARAATGSWLEGLIGMAVAGTLLWWLARPSVRAAFA